MKISLLTIWHECNFGAEMQAYATVKALKKLGHDVEVVDLRLGDSKPKSWKGKLSVPIVKISPAYRSFVDFWQNNIPSGRRYYSLEDLKKNPPEADVYMVGSDQVWNPEITGVLSDAYFLPFGSENINRYSYASSFGTTDWNGTESQTKIAKTQLSKFKNISCRELSGCEILNNTFGLKSVNVLDPTLLHNNFEEITGDIEENNSVVYYPLYNDPKLQESAINIGKILGLSIINANEKKSLKGNLVWKRTSIIDWIKSIGGAKFVVTSSFHGLAFSIIYKRNFAVVINPGRGTRLFNLLNLLGLSNRAFSSYEDLIKSKIWDCPINYDKVNIKLNLLQKNSWDFLANIR